MELAAIALQPNEIYMPELPEVETIRRSLLPDLVGKRVAGVIVHDARLRHPVETEKLQQLLPGSRLRDIRRRGKYLLFDWEGGAVLLVHLGMSGRLGLFDEEQELEPHTHVILSFTDGSQLRFRDPRRFGSMLVYPGDEIGESAQLRHLGVEPLSPLFRASYIQRHAHSSRRPIKNLVMDSRIVVGVGNIYANEALFEAGIDPRRSSDGLSREEIVRLRRSIVKILKWAIRRGGTTLNDFRDGRGEPGFFQIELRVYGRECQACPRCGGEISREVLCGRSTFFCHQCQN